MSVDGEGWDAEGLDHDDRGSFMADTLEGFEFWQSLRDFSVILVQQCLREGYDCAGFVIGEATGADDFLDLLLA